MGDEVKVGVGSQDLPRADSPRHIHVRFVILQAADADEVVPATVVTALDERLPWSLACRVGSPLDLLQLGVGEMSVLRSCCGLLALHEQPAVEHCASSDPVRPGAGPLTARQRSCAAWISLNAIASPRLETRGLGNPCAQPHKSRSVVSIGLNVFRCSQCSAGVVERQQLVEVVADLAAALGH